MNKTYEFSMLLVAVVLLVGGLALVCSDDAEALDKDVRLTFNDDTNVRKAKGLNPITFNYTVIHTGTVLSEEVIVELKNEPGGWQHFLSAQTKAGVRTSTNELELMIQKGERANMSLTITPPLNQLNLTFWMTVNVHIKKDDSTNSSHDFGIVIPQVAGFEIKLLNKPTSGEFTAIPPSEVTLQFGLYNTGNGMDRFVVGYESSRANAGWTMTPTRGLDEYGRTENVSADPERKRPYIMEFKVPIPAGEKADVTCQITVNATSMFNVTKQMPPAFAIIRSLQYYNFQVYINGLDEKEGVPDEQVEFELRIENLGNGWDTFSVKPVWDEELNKDFIASANPREIDIASNETDIVTYIVKVPRSAPKKSYFFTAEVSSSNPDLAIVTKSFSVIVQQYYAIEIKSDEPVKETIPGGIVDYVVTFRNTGNGLDSISIELLGTPKGWLTYIDPPEVSLLPYSPDDDEPHQQDVSIRVIVPERFEEAPIGSNNITIKADSSRSEAEALFDIRLDITQFYRVEWMYQDIAITDPEMPMAQPNIIKPRREVNPHAQQFIDISLEVKNFGNGDDNITVAGRAIDDRITVKVTPAQTKLVRDQVQLIKVTIEFPEDLPPGEYDLLVNTTSQEAGFEPRVVPLTFDVFNLDAAVPAVPTYNDVVGKVVRDELTVERGLNLTFELKVENNGTEPLQPVTLRVYDNFVDSQGEEVRWNFFNFTTPPIAKNDKYSVGEKPFSETNPPLYWWSNVSGEHLLEFRLFYDYQSDSSNDVSYVTVIVEKKEEVETSVIENPAFVGIVVAVAVAALIAVSYIFVLRRKPKVDADLYSSIYGADFEDTTLADEGVAAEGGEAGAELTPEQEALYGDESEYGGEYDYDDYDYDDYDEDYDGDEEQPQA